jgi:hypothetical protein
LFELSFSEHQAFQKYSPSSVFSLKQAPNHQTISMACCPTPLELLGQLHQSRETKQPSLTTSTKIQNGATTAKRKLKRG